MPTVNSGGIFFGARPSVRAQEGQCPARSARLFSLEFGGVASPAERCRDRFYLTTSGRVPDSPPPAGSLRRPCPRRIVRDLGHGGMATVFLAQDRRHDRA
jgi:hypothetical protein